MVVVVVVVVVVVAAAKKSAMQHNDPEYIGLTRKEVLHAGTTPGSCRSFSGPVLDYRRRLARASGIRYQQPNETALGENNEAGWVRGLTDW